MSTTIVWRMTVAAVAILLAAGWLFRGRSHTTIAAADEIEKSVYNATLGFEKIFVLSLPSRTDHRDWMTVSAAVSDLHIEFLDGVVGADVLDKVLPPPADRTLGDGNIGSWRAHMNALNRIVTENITSALIMEDDVDWDIRIKQQMRDFSRGTRTLIQPLAWDGRSFADPSRKMDRPKGAQKKHPLGEDEVHYDIFATDLVNTVTPTDSPYGDDWDVLWPGSCAMHYPRAEDQVPRGRYIIKNDETMLPPAHYKAADAKVLPDGYPPFTRIVHHVWDPICTFAYAVSQRGARKILYEYGIKSLDRAFDNMMCDFCDAHTCLTVSPQLFGNYQAAGPVNRDSDINGFGQDKSTGVREVGRSENIQRSVRLNIEALLDGVPIDQLKDQYPR